ncbi:MAG: nucleoside kinase [Clostridium sp.]
MFEINLYKDRTLELNSEAILNDILIESELENESKLPIVLGEFNGRILELREKVQCNGDFKPIDINNDLGKRTYVRTLLFVLTKAVVDIFPKAKITIEHSISKGIFGEIKKQIPLGADDILAIKNRMKTIIDRDIIINKGMFSKEEAIDLFKSYNMMDKVKILKSIKTDEVKLYELDGRYNYFYGPMAYSTGVLKSFDLISYKPGFLLMYPNQKDSLAIPKLCYYEKLNKIFKEAEEWGHIMGIPDVGSLNELVYEEKIEDIIRVNEGLQEKKIAYIADKVCSNKEVKLVFISGPSSSGKTTFTKKLAIHLRANGKKAIQISMDNYFVDREFTPLDENGQRDFESLDAIDIELFNNQLKRILNEEEVEIPRYDFIVGKKLWEGERVNLENNGIILIEGIHGLNESLSRDIPKNQKFKIYISCLTQLNIDDHNRISTTDVRIVRRIVRDSITRGYSAEATLSMWPSIKRGEEKNIFVFQEEADVMFNSNLIYELCVLKKYALKELSTVKKESPVYYEAKRLMSFLHLFKDVDENIVPDDSLLREFIGGSYFYK